MYCRGRRQSFKGLKTFKKTVVDELINIDNIDYISKKGTVVLNQELRLFGIMKR